MQLYHTLCSLQTTNTAFCRCERVCRIYCGARRTQLARCCFRITGSLESSASHSEIRWSRISLLFLYSRMKKHDSFRGHIKGTECLCDYSFKNSLRETKYSLLFHKIMFSTPDKHRNLNFSSISGFMLTSPLTFMQLMYRI